MARTQPASAVEVSKKMWQLSSAYWEAVGILCLYWQDWGAQVQLGPNCRSRIRSRDIHHWKKIRWLETKYLMIILLLGKSVPPKDITISSCYLYPRIPVDSHHHPSIGATFAVLSESESLIMLPNNGEKQRITVLIIASYHTRAYMIIFYASTKFMCGCEYLYNFKGHIYIHIGTCKHIMYVSLEIQTWLNLETGVFSRGMCCTPPLFGDRDLDRCEHWSYTVEIADLRMKIQEKWKKYI